MDPGIAHTVWLAVVGALALALVGTIIRGLLLGRGGSVADVVNTRQVICASCGWSGEIPKLAKRCPNCGDNNFTT